MISKEAVLDKAYWHGEMPTYDNPFPNGHDAVDVEDIKALPEIDAVQVVRCEECIHWNDWYSEKQGFHKMCEEHYWSSKPTDFCSFGRRVDEPEMAPVAHAKWKPKGVIIRSPLAKNYYCSRCEYDTAEQTGYCPGCGAKMDGVE